MLSLFSGFLLGEEQLNKKSIGNNKHTLIPNTLIGFFILLNFSEAF
jgi:hypothetical protein